MVEVEKKEVPTYLHDFSKSKPANSVITRLCECKRVHLTFHDETGMIYAHADFGDVDGLDRLGETFKHYATLLKQIQSEDQIQA